MDFESFPIQEIQKLETLLAFKNIVDLMKQTQGEDTWNNLAHTLESLHGHNLQLALEYTHNKIKHWDNTYRILDIHNCNQKLPNIFPLAKQLNLFIVAGKSKSLPKKIFSQKNDHISHLSLNYFHNITDLSLLQNLTNLQSLELNQCDSLIDLSPLHALKDLNYIHMCQCKNIKLNTLTSIPNLTHLEIDCHPNQLKQLNQLQSITALTLFNSNNITNINCIQTLTNLQELDISGSTNLKNIKPLQFLTNLKRLNLDWCDSITDPKPLTQLTKLEELSTYGSNFLPFLPFHSDRVLKCKHKIKEYQQNITDFYHIK